DRSGKASTIAATSVPLRMKPTVRDRPRVSPRLARNRPTLALTAGISVTNGLAATAHASGPVKRSNPIPQSHIPGTGAETILPSARPSTPPSRPGPEPSLRARGAPPCASLDLVDIQGPEDKRSGGLGPRARGGTAAFAPRADRANGGA